MASGTIKKALLPTTYTTAVSADVKTPWTFTAPSAGMLNLMLRSNSRSYISVLWNGNMALAFALSGTQENLTQQIFCKAGDVVEVNGLNANTYLLSATNFISFE